MKAIEITQEKTAEQRESKVRSHLFSNVGRQVLFQADCFCPFSDEGV